jgi:hypothetical protein
VRNSTKSLDGRSSVAIPERRDQREPLPIRESGEHQGVHGRPRVISDQEPEHDPPQQQRGGLLRRHPSIAFAILAVVPILSVGCVMWWLHARNYESTDDAFIDARDVSVSPQVVGAITEVPVTDNQLVQTGSLLVQIDPREKPSVPRPNGRKHSAVRLRPSLAETALSSKPCCGARL